jgi:DedD protein
MGLFSSGNKDEAPSRRSKAPADRSGEGRRTRGEGRSQQGSMLDPTLPEKQRARHRLIGAIAMVLAAVIGLPMVLDSHPRPASDDIAIDIPSANKSATVPTRVVPAPDQTTATATPSTADTSTPAKPSTLASSSATATKPAEKSTTVTTVVAGQQPGSPGAPAAPTPMVMPPTSANPVPAPTVAPAAPAPRLPASAAGSRFVVSVGSFTSDTSAHAWLNKLKGAGVPAYLEQKRQPDGSPRILLRAGPFSDRSSAEAAVKKVRDAGLSAQSNEAPGAAK